MYLGKPVIGNFKQPREKRRRQKSPAEKREGKDEVYLAKLRSLPCCVCGNPPQNTVHHLKQTGQRGGAMKSQDRWGLPMCMFPQSDKNCHGELEQQGSKNEIGWFQKRGIDPLTLAANLWNRRHSLEEMERVLMAHVPREDQ